MATRNVEQEIDRLTQSLDEIRHSIAEVGGRVGHRMGEAAENAADEGRRYGRWAGRAASHTAHSAGRGVRRGASAAYDEIEERPLTVAGLALAVGFLVGRYFSR